MKGTCRFRKIIYLICVYEKAVFTLYCPLLCVYF